MKLDSFDEGPKCFLSFCGAVASAAARLARMLLVDWFVLGPRKSRGWDFRAVLRSDRDWWRWSERISGEHWRRLLMLSASSLSAFDTSAESRMQGSLKRARTVLGVWHDKSRSTIIGSMSIYRLKNHVTKSVRNDEDLLFVILV